VEGFDLFRRHMRFADIYLNSAGGILQVGENALPHVADGQQAPGRTRRMIFGECSAHLAYGRRSDKFTTIRLATKRLQTPEIFQPSRFHACTGFRL
jgi:hypothetical protein